LFIIRGQCCLKVITRSMMQMSLKTLKFEGTLFLNMHKKIMTNEDNNVHLKG